MIPLLRRWRHGAPFWEKVCDGMIDTAVMATVGSCEIHPWGAFSLFFILAGTLLWLNDWFGDFLFVFFPRRLGPNFVLQQGAIATQYSMDCCAENQSEDE